ncbi:ABC transporter ATP-binding protein [Castellaniella sp. MT123]|uniref:ABC transporter ATP-binding protein n=1 Tax=Castellaniella sp. MT123 TaxID=3140381 RepID=UPI0031F342A5
MTTPVVIRAEHVSKQYRLGVINHGTLYRDLQSWYARWRGQPDPNASLSEMSQQRGAASRTVGDRFRALDDVSFEIRQGDVTGIIGSNGAGKSTLLKVISRITDPTSGRITLKGRVASLLEVGTGFHPELTGRENVFLNGAILGMRRHEVAAKFERIVEFAEIGRFIDTPVKRYSSGMYVRLAFSVAAHLEPEILLVDEVLAVGDASFQKKCMGRMQEVGRDGRTILFVSHNMTAINSICPNTICVEDGRVAEIGPTSMVVQNYLARGQVGANGVYMHKPEDLDGKAIIYKVASVDATGRESGALDLSQEFSIEIQYELREVLSGIHLSLQILAEDGYTSIFSVSDVELQPDLLNPRQPGRYRANVKFPSCALNTGAYYVYVGLASRFSIFSTVSNLRVEVIDRVGIIQMLGHARKPSVSAMQFPWTTERI